MFNSPDYNFGEISWWKILEEIKFLLKELANCDLLILIKLVSLKYHRANMLRNIDIRSLYRYLYEVRDFGD